MPDFTPSAELEAALAADEAARSQPAPETDVTETTEPTAEPTADNTETAEPIAEPEDTDGDKTDPEPENDFEKRIARLAFEKRQAERKAREQEAELRRLRGEAPALHRDEQIEQEVERRAAERAAVKAFNDRANAIHQAGVQSYGRDFDAKLAALRDAGLSLSAELVEAADEAGDPARIIHYLGRNIDIAERVMSLPPHRLGAALAKIAIETTPKPKQHSKAPPPIKPISGKITHEPPDDAVSMDEYMRREQERSKTRKGRFD